MKFDHLFLEGTMIEIKRLTENKVKEFVNIHLKCWEETYVGIFPHDVMESRWNKKEDREKYIKKQLQHKDYYYFSLTRNDEIIGILIFSIIDEVALLDAIYIKKKYQRKGYGKKLLELMEIVLKKQKMQQYSVYVFQSLQSNEFFLKKDAVLIEEDFITIHGRDYKENLYEIKVGE